MTVTDEASDLRELRARVTAELKALLVERTPSSRSTVLGAGSNDRTPGQQFLQLLAPGGYMTPGWPAEYGGMGLDQAASDVVVDVRSGFEAPDLYPWMVGLDLVGPTILTHATVEQARRWLAPIRTGTEIWCQLFSEPDAGSDLANVKARAVRDGDAWRLNGSKVDVERALLRVGAAPRPDRRDGTQAPGDHRLRPQPAPPRGHGPPPRADER
jgi:alkylation response protein AidB-like acyl-CoA dehydrogenase